MMIGKLDWEKIWPDSVRKHLAAMLCNSITQLKYVSYVKIGKITMR